MNNSQKEVLQSQNFRFRKQYGQNFLSDTNLLNAIAADSGITADETAVEVGTGAGALTKALAGRARRVVSFEIDTSLQPVLEQTLKGFDNITVIFSDIMKERMEEIEKLAGGQYRVVANLPYYITTPVLMRFIEEAENVTSLTLTVQKEVAERLTAKPDTKDYGAVTAATEFFGHAKITRNISRNMFYPVPNVDSAVVHIEKRSVPFDCGRSEFRQVVKSAFAMRRKTLVNNLSASFNRPREIFLPVFEKIGISPLARGETLGVEDFCNLAKELKAAEILK